MSDAREFTENWAASMRRKLFGLHDLRAKHARDQVDADDTGHDLDTLRYKHLVYQLDAIEHVLRGMHTFRARTQ